MPIASSLELHTPGLLAALPWGDVLTVCGCATVVFGANKLVPTFDPTFYKQLRKPSWNPPNWVFPAVWIPLKVLQTVRIAMCVQLSQGKRPRWRPSSWSSSVHHRTHPFQQRCFWGTSPSEPTGTVRMHEVHRDAPRCRTVVFFGKRKLRESLGWMGAFVASVFGTSHQVQHAAALERFVAGCVGAFYPVSTLAARLMVPTSAWVCVAAKLNYDIVSLNTKGKKNN